MIPFAHFQLSTQLATNYPFNKTTNEIREYQVKTYVGQLMKEWLIKIRHTKGNY
jgi:hypothetical protein